MTNTLQYSIVTFVIIALIFSIFTADKLQKSEKKHMIAACFVFGAAVVHAAMIVLNLD
jgi:dipeptide/tripeptide permease